MPKKGSDRWFNTKHEISEQDTAGTYLDPSDVKAHTKQAVIDFYQLATKDDKPAGNSVAFKAFITDFSESHELRYGDALSEHDESTFQGPGSETPTTTVRNINLSWKTVAASIEEAEENMVRLSELVRMFHKKVKKDDFAGELRVRFAQWLVDGTSVAFNNPGQFAPADTTGLFVQARTISYTFDMEAGSFDTIRGIFPKVINITCAMQENPRKVEEGKYAKVTTTGDHYKKRYSKLPFGYGNMKEGKAPQTPSKIEKMNDDEYDKYLETILTRGK